MPNDVIITPSTGRVQFVKDTGQALLRYNIDLSPATGLIIDSPLTSSVGIKSPNLADLSGSNTFAGATTFNGATTINGNLSVYGATNIFSASNIYITSSVLTVTDNILTLNALSPYQRYAGIEMYDTGSGTLSSILWDGTNDYFFLTGSGVNGKLITGPDGQTDLTSNYIPKATAGYKLGNSVIYETGSNIGIGTTSPGATLHVSGSSGATATFQGSTQSTMNLKVGSFDNYLVGTSTGDISIRPSGSTAVTILSGGNVGIGTTNPSGILDIQSSNSGDQLVRNWNTNTSGTGKSILRIANSGNNAQGTQLQFTDLNYYVGTISSDRTNGMAFYVGQQATPLVSERMRIDINGNVGIGTTSPVSKLHIEQIQNAESLITLRNNRQDFGDVPIFGISAQNNTTDVAKISFYRGGGGNSGYLTFSTKFDNASSLTEKVRIDGAGNVGIGTTNPSAKFHVTSSTNADEVLIGTIGNDQIVGGRTGGSFGISTKSTSNGNLILTSGDAFYIRTSGSNDRVIVKNDGNFGIGTTNPTSKLHIVTTGTNDGIILDGTSNPIFVHRTSGSDRTYLATTTSAGAFFTDAGQYDFIIRSQTNNILLGRGSGASTMAIVGNNVGIGTTLPSASLHIKSSTSGATLLRTDGTNGTLFSVVDDLSDSLMSVNNSAGLPVLEVFADDRIVAGQYGQNDLVVINNKIGIGTNNPIGKLHVTSSTSIPSAVFLGGSVGIGLTTPAYSLHVRDSANVGTIAIGHGLYPGLIIANASSGEFRLDNRTSAAAGFITFYPNGEAGTLGNEAMRISNSRKVGIGTTLPTASLHIKPTALGADLLILERYASQAKLVYAYEYAADGYLEVRSGADVIISKISGYASTPTYFQSNVGIGITAPTTPLHVVGVISGSSFSGAGTGLTGTATSLTVGNATSASYALVAATANNVNNGQLSFASGSGITISAGTFTANQSGNTAFTISLSSNSVTVGSTAIALGGTATTIAGLTSVTSTGFTGSLVGTSSWASNVVTNANLTGDVTSVGNATTIANNAVTTAKILDANVTNAKLANSSLTIGSTAISLGGTATTIAGLSSLTSTNLTSSNIYVSGTVGIGILSPSYKTEIYSGTKTSAFTGLAISNFNNYDGTAASLVTSQLRFAILESPITTYDSSQRTFAILESGNEANNSSSDGFFAISTRSGGTVAQKFRITSTGNVGIGTASPTSLLELSSSTASSLLHVKGTGTWGSSILFVSSSGRIGLGTSNPTYGLVIQNYTTTQTGQVYINAALNSSGKGLVIDSNTRTTSDNSVLALEIINNAGTNTLAATVAGNVGIGTTSPVQLLELRKTSASAIALLNYNDTVKLNLNASSGNAGYVGMVTNHPLIFVTNDTEKVRIDTSGNVGIGTTSAGQKLDVEGRIRTRGATGTGGFEIGAATTGTAKWRIEWDSASDSLDFNWVG